MLERWLSKPKDMGLIPSKGHWWC